jgi:hypothetical protein
MVVKGTRSWALAPPRVDGCPILRVLCEGWDDQISPLNLPRKTDLFLRRPGPYPCNRIVIPTEESWVLGPPEVMKNGSCSATTVDGGTTLPFVISTGAQRSGEICGHLPPCCFLSSVANACCRSATAALYPSGSIQTLSPAPALARSSLASMSKY